MQPFALEPQYRKDLNWSSWSSANLYAQARCVKLRNLFLLLLSWLQEGVAVKRRITAWFGIEVFPLIIYNWHSALTYSFVFEITRVFVVRFSEYLVTDSEVIVSEFLTVLLSPLLLYNFGRLHSCRPFPRQPGHRWNRDEQFDPSTPVARCGFFKYPLKFICGLFSYFF